MRERDVGKGLGASLLKLLFESSSASRLGVLLPVSDSDSVGDMGARVGDASVEDEAGEAVQLIYIKNIKQAENGEQGIDQRGFVID